MNEADARNVILLRAFETSTPRTDAWNDDDRAWASRAAAEVVGSGADAEQFLARRAALAVERLDGRDRNVQRTLRAMNWRPWVGWVIVAVAFALGLAMDAIGPAQRVNILAFPLLALIAWNLVVYLLLIGSSVVSITASDNVGPGPLRRGVARLALGIAHALPANASTPLLPFTHDWTKRSSPLLLARAARVLHWAAFAFALGAIVSLYLRGLVLEYRAGWESTFLDAESVRHLLSYVLAPASAITGIAVPDAGHIDAIQFSKGPGEHAGPWLHLFSAVIALFVLLPRALLALISQWREKRLIKRFPLTIDDAYFQGFLRAHRGERARIRVIPYSYHLSPQSTLGFNRVVTRVFGSGADVSVAPAVAFGGEDALPSDLVPADRPALVAVVFSLTATPEAEHHNVFVNAIAQRAGMATPVAVIVDESGFRERFAGQPGRQEERRNAWRRLLETTGREPVFVDLVTPDLTRAEAALAAIVDQVPSRTQERTTWPTRSN
jgi:hypothetical protein